MPEDIYSRTMQKAAEVAGGEDKLARELKVKVAEVRGWISGQHIPPLASFFAATQLIRNSGQSKG